LHSKEDNADEGKPETSSAAGKRRKQEASTKPGANSKKRQRHVDSSEDEDWSVAGNQSKLQHAHQRKRFYKAHGDKGKQAAPKPGHASAERSSKKRRPHVDSTSHSEGEAAVDLGSDDSCMITYFGANSTESDEPGMNTPPMPLSLSPALDEMLLGGS
jgi:hypothetical protein